MKKVDLKLDEDTIATIERFAADNNLTKSSAYRLLLMRAINGEIQDAYIAEIIHRVQTALLGGAGKLVARWKQELTDVLGDALGESVEVIGDIPPISEAEREIISARSPGQKPGPAAPLAPAPGLEPEGDELEPIENEAAEETAAEEAVAPIDTAADEREDAEKLYWENYQTMLAEIGADEGTKAVADEAGKIVAKYNTEAVAAGWRAPEWGTEDFEARKKAAFPNGGVRGRR
jgi:hypothetical protein